MTNNNYIKYFYILIFTLSSNFITCIEFMKKCNAVSQQIQRLKIENSLGCRIKDITDKQLDDQEICSQVIDYVLYVTGNDNQNHLKNHGLTNNEKNNNNDMSEQNETVLYKNTIQFDGYLENFKINKKNNLKNLKNDNKEKIIMKFNNCFLNLFLDQLDKGKFIQQDDIKTMELKKLLSAGEKTINTRSKKIKKE
jgi:hypothetical protein